MAPWQPGLPRAPAQADSRARGATGQEVISCRERDIRVCAGGKPCGSSARGRLDLPCPDADAVRRPSGDGGLALLLADRVRPGRRRPRGERLLPSPPPVATDGSPRPHRQHPLRSHRDRRRQRRAGAALEFDARGSFRAGPKNESTRCAGRSADLHRRRQPGARARRPHRRGTVALARAKPVALCGTVNRGVAAYGDRIFWPRSTRGSPRRDGATATCSPWLPAAAGKIIVGASGASSDPRPGDNSTPPRLAPDAATGALRCHQMLPHNLWDLDAWAGAADMVVEGRRCCRAHAGRPGSTSRPPHRPAAAPLPALMPQETSSPVPPATASYIPMIYAIDSTSRRMSEDPPSHTRWHRLPDR
jgi:hypothetical protein